VKRSLPLLVALRRWDLDKRTRRKMDFTFIVYLTMRVMLQKPIKNTKRKFNLLFNAYQGVKRPGCEIDHSSPSSKVK
jgi:hypothetical protein